MGVLLRCAAEQPRLAPKVAGLFGGGLGAGALLHWWHVIAACIIQQKYASAAWAGACRSMWAGRLPTCPPPVAHPFLPPFFPPLCPHPLFLPAAFHLTADAFSVTDQVALLDAISALLDASATSAAGVALLLHFGPPVQRHFHLEAVLEDLVGCF